MATFRSDLYEDVGSDVTSSTYFIGDAEELSAEIIIGSASTTSIQLSNATGFRETISEDDWSTSTTVVSSADDMLNIEPGPRWLRAIRTSGVSQFVVAGRNDAGR